MKLRESLVLVLVLSLAMVPAFSLQAKSQSQYGERIDVYTVGANAYTYVTLSQLNLTSAALTSAESTSGLNGYRIVALSTQDSVSDYQVFGPDGYNVLNVPSVPTDGVFLFVNASSASAAAPLVSYVDGLLGTNLTLTSSSGASYTYSGLVDFTGVAAPALYKFVPTTEGGFASILGEGTLTGLPLPTITLLAVKNGSSFDHSISLGAASNGVISSVGALSFLKVLGGTNSTVTASSGSASSEVVVHALDGLIYSTDSAASTSRNTSGFSSVYSLPVAAGKTVAPNMTIATLAPTLNAYRTVSLSSQAGSQVLSVTIWLSNTAENQTTQNMVIQNVTLDDNWWQNDPTVFQLSPGTQSYNATVAQIVGGHNTTLVYSLNVISSSPSEVIIPAGTVSYTYTIGTQVFHKQTTLNEVDVQLNGNAEPAINIIAQPDSKYLSGSPIGSNASIVVTISNSGSAPATNLKVGSNTFANLPANTVLPSFKVPLTITGLTQRNFTQSLALTWSTPEDQTENITSNSVTLIMSHSAMLIPYTQIGINGSITAQTLASKALNVSYSFTNQGSANSGPVTATQPLPRGVSCSVLNNGSGNVSCGANQVTFTFSGIRALASHTVELTLTFSPNDYIFSPSSANTSYGGATLHTSGQGYALPAGLVATKSFSPAIVFPGMKSVVTVGLTNNGSQTLYNVTLSSADDSFDSVSSSTPLQKTFASIAPHQSASFTYNVTVSKESSGNLSAASVTASFLLGGTSQSLPLGAANLLVYKPLAVTAAASPTGPETGKQFSVTFTVSNAAPVAVSNIRFNWTLPSGVSIVSGASSTGRLVTQSIPSLGPDSNDNFTLTLTADIGLTVDTGTSHLSYQYEGTTLSGAISSNKISVKEDVTTNYAIPIVLAILIALAALVYVRRSSQPTRTA